MIKIKKKTKLFYFVNVTSKYNMNFWNLLFSKDSLNNYFDNIQVITLPKRAEYVKNIFSYSNMNINYNQFLAVDGTRLDLQDLISKNKLSYPNKLKHRNEVACYLSHISVIKNFYDNAVFDRSTLFVFEDDIILDTDYLQKVKKVMFEIPNNWEFINFGRCWDDCKLTKKINPGSSIGISDRALCAHSYAITKTGAKKILDKAFPIVEPVDVYYTQLAKTSNLKFYSAVPRIFNQLKSLTADKKTEKTFNKNMTSTLDNNDTCLECRD